MVAHEVKVAALLLLACSIEASVIAPAPIAYTKAVPYNVLPFANSVNIFSKALHPQLVAAYAGIAPAIVRAPHAAYAPAFAPAYAPVPVHPAPALGPAPGLAPAPIPALRVSSFLPEPFAAAPGFLPAAHDVAEPVVKSFAPAPIAPAFAPSVYAHPVNPAFGRSIHSVAPHGFPSPVVPAIAPAPSW